MFESPRPRAQDNPSLSPHTTGRLHLGGWLIANHDQGVSKDGDRPGRAGIVKIPLDRSGTTIVRAIDARVDFVNNNPEQIAEAVQSLAATGAIVGQLI